MLNKLADWLVESTERVLTLLIVAIVLLFGTRNSTVLSLAHFVSISRAAIVIGFLGLGVLVVLLIGGIDVSFTAIAAASMYTTVTIFRDLEADPGLLVLFLSAIAIGAAFGVVNAFLIVRLGVPTLLATLGMLSLVRGGLLFFVGTERISDVPQSMIDLSRSRIGEFTTANGGTIGVHVTFVALIVVASLVWAILKWTMIGRTIFAIGSNREAAMRVGLPVRAAETSVYVAVGGLAGAAGLLSAALIRQADPFSLVGDELTVIAAVVLGGASITGGRGSVLGTGLGIALITIVGGSLILIGLPTKYQTLIVGSFLLLGVSLPAWREWRKARQRGEPRIYRTAS